MYLICHKQQNGQLIDEIQVEKFDKTDSSEEDSDVRNDSGMLFDDLNTSDLIEDYEEETRADRDEAIQEATELDTSDLDAYLKSNDDDKGWL